MTPDRLMRLSLELPVKTDHDVAVLLHYVLLLLRPRLDDSDPFTQELYSFAIQCASRFLHETEN